MRKPSQLAALLLVACVAAAPIPYLQQLEEGNWTGTATGPDGMTYDVIYEIKNTEEGQTLTLQVPEAGMAVPAEELKLEGDKLTFFFAVDMDSIACSLERQDDGSFEGECIDQDGGGGWLVMKPPSGTAG